MSKTVKKFLYLHRKAPYGTIHAWEALEVVLIGAAFDQDVRLLFLDDGVYQLVTGQDTRGIGMKNFSPAYRTLGDYDIRKIYIDRASLEIRGLAPDDLIAIPWEDPETGDVIETIIEVVERARVSALMNEADAIFSF